MILRFPSPPVILPLLFLLLCSATADEPTCSGIVPMKTRPETISITDFGGVGDGQNLNTNAFKEAIFRIEHLHHGGTTLYVPPGVWLTGPFNLTSHMTLFLARGAVIKATQVLIVVFQRFILLG